MKTMRYFLKKNRTVPGDFLNRHYCWCSDIFDVPEYVELYRVRSDRSG